MADLSDVLDALVATIGGILYPGGAVSPTSPSAIGAACKIYPGWPIAKQLEADLANPKIDIAHVSVYARQEEKATTRFPEDWETLSINPTTLTATVAGTTVTIGGAVAVPQNVALLVNTKGYAYGVKANDSLATIAAALAALVNADTPATSSGAVISIPGATQRLVGRVGTTGTSIMEVGRQQKQFQIGLWCPKPELRDAAAKLINPALRKIRFLTLADGSAGRLIYERTIQFDDPKNLSYRRDLFYSVEYPDTLTETDTQVLIDQINIKGGISPTGAVDPNGPAVATIYE